MAAKSNQAKIKNASPKVKNANRGPGYWVGLAASRSNRDRSVIYRDVRTAVNYPHIGQVGSAAYRRLRNYR